MSKIGVLLADDHAVLREGLAVLISQQADMQVLAEVANGLEAVAACQAHRPNVALIDLSMPQLGGLEAISHILEDCPGTRVVVLTMHDNPTYLRSALGAGATGFVTKALASREILDAVRAGQMFIRISHADDILDVNVGRRRGEPAAVLSKRERQVLRLIAYGYTHQETANALGIGKKSVDTYRARLQRKLHLTGRSEIVRYALATGVLSQGPPLDEELEG